MYLINLIYKKPLNEVDRFLAAHRAYLDECYAKNYYIVSGPKNPRVGGFILTALGDKEKVQLLIQADPFYKNDVAEFEIVEFSPVKYHSHFQFFINLLESN